MSRSIEYLVEDLLNRLDDYWWTGESSCPEGIAERRMELRSVLAGSESSEFEQWVVSQRGKVVHLWTHMSGGSKTLCGRSIRKDGYQLFSSIPGFCDLTECGRCENIAACS